MKTPKKRPLKRSKNIKNLASVFADVIDGMSGRWRVSPSTKKRFNCWDGLTPEEAYKLGFEKGADHEAEQERLRRRFGLPVEHREVVYGHNGKLPLLHPVQRRRASVPAFESFTR